MLTKKPNFDIAQFSLPFVFIVGFKKFGIMKLESLFDKTKIGILTFVFRTSGDGHQMTVAKKFIPDEMKNPDLT